MKKSLRKIDLEEKNTILEMHKNRGYRTIVEDMEDMSSSMSDEEDFMSDIQIDNKPENDFDELSFDMEDELYEDDEEEGEDPSIPDEDFLDIYAKDEMMENEKTKEKEKEKTKEKEKDKKRSNPFKDPNPGTQEDPRGKKKMDESKKTVRLTESDLIKLIKRAIKNS